MGTRDMGVVMIIQFHWAASEVQESKVLLACPEVVMQIVPGSQTSTAAYKCGSSLFV